MKKKVMDFCCVLNDRQESNEEKLVSSEVRNLLTNYADDIGVESLADIWTEKLDNGDFFVYLYDWGFTANYIVCWKTVDRTKYTSKEELFIKEWFCSEDDDDEYQELNMFYKDWIISNQLK